MTYKPPLEVPADLIAWMRQQSCSEFVGSMLRVIDRTGGVSSWQLAELHKMRNFQAECQCPNCGRLHLKLANNPPASISGEWKCGARASIDPPQDCDWPLCSCDPYANKVKASLHECGVMCEG